jgi:hypothetical protein
VESGEEFPPHLSRSTIEAPEKAGPRLADLVIDFVEEVALCFGGGPRIGMAQYGEKIGDFLRGVDENYPLAVRGRGFPGRGGDQASEEGGQERKEQHPPRDTSPSS